MDFAEESRSSVYISGLTPTVSKPE